MQMILVFVLIAIAAFWLGRRIFKMLRPKKKDGKCDSCG
jgi:hypothetical protein